MQYKNITLQQALNGTSFTIFAQGHYLKVDLPPLTAEGQVIRLPKKENLKSDVLIKIRILEHPRFTIHDENIITTLRLNSGDAYTGKRIQFEGPAGNVLPVIIKKRAKDGDVVRIPRQGFEKDGKRGDLVLILKTQNVADLLEAKSAEETGIGPYSWN